MNGQQITLSNLIATEKEYPIEPRADTICVNLKTRKEPTGAKKEPTGAKKRANWYQK